MSDRGVNAGGAKALGASDLRFLNLLARAARRRERGCRARPPRRRRRTLPSLVPAPAARRLRLPAARRDVTRGRDAAGPALRTARRLPRAVGPLGASAAGARASWRRCCATKASPFWCSRDCRSRSATTAPTIGAPPATSTSGFRATARPRWRSCSSGAASSAALRATTRTRRRSSTFTRSSSTSTVSASSCTMRCGCTARSGSTSSGCGRTGRGSRCRESSTTSPPTSTPSCSTCSGSIPTSRSARPTRAGSPTSSACCSNVEGALVVGRVLRGARRRRHAQDLRQQPGAVPGADPQRRTVPGALARWRRRRHRPPRRPSFSSPIGSPISTSCAAPRCSERKLWPLRQYEEGTAAAVSWWVAGMPRRIAAKPDAFARDVSPGPRAACRGRPPSSRATRSELENEFGVDPATFQETFLRFGSLGVQVRYQTAAISTRSRSSSGCARARWASPRRRRPTPAERACDLVLHVFLATASSSRCCACPASPSCAARSSDCSRSTTASRICGCARPRPQEGDGRRSAPRQGFLAIDRAAETRPLLLHSLMVVLNKLLVARSALPPARGGRGGGRRHLAVRRRQGQRQVDHHAGARQGGRRRCSPRTT